MQNNVNDQQNNSIEKSKEKRLDKSLVQVQWIYVGFFFLLASTLAPSSLKIMQVRYVRYCMGIQTGSSFNSDQQPVTRRNSSDGAITVTEGSMQVPVSD